MAKIKSITKRKYIGKVYDLTVKDLCAYNVEGLSVHNSAVSSLCLYVLGITKLDPIKYDLIFERFLNPERISPPDVDIDFDYDKREKVYEYIVNKYGEDHCCQIGTYNSFKGRAVIRYVAKALDIGNDWEAYQKAKANNPNSKIEMTKNSLNLADAIAKQIPLKAGDLNEALKQSEDFRASMHRYPKLLECSRHIEGCVSFAGVHPAGIIVCKTSVKDQVPMRSSKGVISSQYDGPEVEELGLLKFDLLALKTLTVIDRTVEMVKERRKNDPVAQALDIDSIEPNDPSVLKEFMRNTTGIFQMESPGMSRLLENIRVDSFEDLIVANALYRPGPLGEGMHDMYAEYKRHPNKIEYLHPKMGSALKDTYGIIVYQENIMKISQVLAGFTGGQADTLRKVVGKKKPELVKKEKLDEKFINGCVKNGISSEIAKKIFDQIFKFAAYGFNKCLSGDTLVLNKVDNKTYTLEELEEIFKTNNRGYAHGTFVVDSYVDGKTVDDDILNVFETGEKEIYEVKLSSGMIVKCTLDHKFYCSDGKSHTVKEIMEKDIDVLCE